MDTTLLSIIGGIIVLAIIIAAMVIRYKSNSSAFDKESATEFLEGLSDIFYEKIMDIINNINFADYDSLIELEASILSQIYDTIWEYVEKKLKEDSKTNIFSALTLKILNKEFVDKFVDKLLTEYNIVETMESGWSNHFNSKDVERSIVEEDKNLQDKFSDSSQFVETSDNSELPPAQDIAPSEEELAALNPQSDDEEELDIENDDSVELVDGNNEELPYIIDANGRKRDRKSGRYIK